MRNDCFSFSNAASRNAKALFGAMVLLLASASAASAAVETPHALPEAPVSEVNRNANGSQYQIGDRITLEARVPPGVLETGDPVRLTEEGGKESSQWLLDPHPEVAQGTVRFIVAPVQTGELELPKLRISREGRDPVAVTGAYKISVSGPTAEPGKSPELLPVMEISLSWSHRILIAFLFLVFCISAYWIYRKLRARKTSTSSISVPPAPSETPDELAVRRIESLFKLYPYSPVALKPVCFGCSEILKDFLSARFQVDASESTTREMLDLLRGSGMERDSLREIETLFSTLDLVKFTREENFKHLNEVDYSSVRAGALLIIDRWRSAPERVEARP